MLQENSLLLRDVDALLDGLKHGRDLIDAICDEIIMWNIKRLKENKAHIFTLVIRGILIKTVSIIAMDSALCALLIHKLIIKMGPTVQDEGVVDPQGNPVVGC